MRPSLSAALALLAAIVCVARAQTPLPLCSADTDGVTVSELVVDSVSSDIQVLQMGEEGDNIVILSSAGSLYTSSDRGRTYAKVPNIEPLASASGERDRRYAFFLPRASSNRMWVTEDAGRTFQQRLFPGTVVSCDYHPTLAQAVLCIIKDGCGWWSTCYHSYVTSDFGRTWQNVAGYVRAAIWAYSTHPGVVSAPDSILVTHTGQTKGGQSFSSSDYSLYGCRASKLDTCTANPLVRGVMFISASLVEGVAFAWGDTRSSVELWASRNFDFRFTRLELPSEFSELSGAASIFAFGRPSGGFIGVSPDYPGGTLYYDVYTSDSWLNDFAFSLGKVVRASGGGADINDFDGLSGVVIANVWAAQGTPTSSSPIQTMITYDNGGKWHRLTPPPGAACPDTTCYLNLAGPAELGASYFYSNYDAIGLMMGVGTVGSSLGRTDQRTYLTVDGGVTWSEFYAGPGVYEFADHGGFIGFVPTGAATNSLVYSYTGGQQISSCGFSASLMNVANIATTGEESLDFWVYGTRALPNRAVQSVVVTVSFSAVHERVCTPDDYEAFVPSGFGGSCEMGARVGYQRKKLDAECFNPLNWTSTVVSTEACPCSDEDYECDWCYEYNEFTDTCEFVCEPSAFGRPPPDCPDKWYPSSNGWRLVAGTQCLIDAFGALDRLGAPQACPPPTTPPPETADPTTATGGNGADASVAASVSSVTTAIEASATASVVSVATTAAAAVDSVNAATTSLASSTASLSTSADSVNAATSALSASAAALTSSLSTSADSVNAASTAQATSTSTLTSSSGASAASLSTSLTSLAAAQATLSAASAAADSAASAAASLSGSVTGILSTTADTSLSASVAAFGTSARSATQAESTLATTSQAASASRSLSLTTSLSDTRASLSASTASTLATRTSATSAAISTQMESTNAATTTRTSASSLIRATATTSTSQEAATSLAAASVSAVSASVSTSVATVARTATALASAAMSSTASLASTTTAVDSTTTASVSTTAAATTGTPPPNPKDSHIGALLAAAVVLILIATLGIAFWVRFRCKPAELRQWWQRTFRARPRDTFTLDDGEVEAGTVSASPLVPMGTGSSGSPASAATPET